MFERATRLKLRFESTQGFLSVEDLWELPLTSTRSNVANLNSVAKQVNSKLKADREEDFIDPKSEVDELLQLKLDIVKHIIKVKQDEVAAANDRVTRREKKNRLLELIQRKQDKALEETPLEELQAMVEGL